MKALAPLLVTLALLAGVLLYLAAVLETATQPDPVVPATVGEPVVVEGDL